MWKVYDGRNVMAKAHMAFGRWAKKYKKYKIWFSRQNISHRSNNQYILTDSTIIFLLTVIWWESIITVLTAGSTMVILNRHILESDQYEVLYSIKNRNVLEIDSGEKI